MDNAEFEKSLTECKETLEILSKESKEVSEKICRLLEEHDGDSDELYWNCRTMNKSVDDVLAGTGKRLDRFKAGDRRELPTVLILAIECCERLRDTAELCRAGKQDERRDLKGQITSNLVYLAHHVEAMDEDDILSSDETVFEELQKIVPRLKEDEIGLDELIEFACTRMDPVHEYLEKLRRESFWEEE